MELTERQYDRVGRYLDGEPVDLTDEERAAAGEIAALEASVGAELDAAPPREAMDRAQRRMTAALAANPRPRRRWWVPAAGALAAAAAVVIAVALWTPEPPPVDAGRQAANPYDAVSEELAQELLAGEDYAEIELLDTKIDELEAELVLTESDPGVEDDLDRLEEDIDSYMQDPWLTDEMQG